MYCTRKVKPSHVSRKSILKTRPLPALKHLSSLSGFDKDFCRLLYKCAQDEADLGCRTLSESGPKDMGRDDVLNFSSAEYHGDLCSKFPILMTTLTAIVSKDRSWEEAFLVSNLERSLIQCFQKGPQLETFSQALHSLIESYNSGNYWAFKKKFSNQMPTAPCSHGPRGAKVDLRNVLVPTASRLLHQRHPRQVTKYATLQSLHNAVQMVPGKEQAKANRMGDAYSQKEASAILGKVCEDFDAPAKALKRGIESLYLGPGMFGASARHKAATARRLGVRGIQLGGDNVALVRIKVSFATIAHSVPVNLHSIFLRLKLLGSTLDLATRMHFFSRLCSSCSRTGSQQHT